jgi:hypothetical protein
MYGVRLQIFSQDTVYASSYQFFTSYALLTGIVHRKGMRDSTARAAIASAYNPTVVGSGSDHA